MPVVFGIGYVAKGTDRSGRPYFFGIPVEKDGVVWRTGNWRPSKEVKTEFKKAIGPDGLMVYYTEDYEEGVDNIHSYN